jgi:hypothetical protein
MKALVLDPVIDPTMTEVHRMLATPRRSDGGLWGRCADVGR